MHLFSRQGLCADKNVFVVLKCQNVFNVNCTTPVPHRNNHMKWWNVLFRHWHYVHRASVDGHPHGCTTDNDTPYLYFHREINSDLFAKDLVSLFLTNLRKTYDFIKFLQNGLTIQYCYSFLRIALQSRWNDQHLQKTHWRDACYEFQITFSQQSFSWKWW